MSDRNDAIITGLPEALQRVPADAEAWRTWRREVWRHRVVTTSRAANDETADKRFQQLEFERCRRDPAYFLTMYGVVFEPRAEDSAWEGGFLPFVPYPFQVQMIRFFDELMKARGAKADGVISKSRDMGASWIACLWALHGWLFRDPFVVGMVSRKEELVDLPGDMESLFEKIVSNMERLPPFLMPDGFEWKFHRQKLRIRNPTNKNLIKGESTTSNSGRGGRATVRIYDEAAFIPEFMSVWGTGANSTNHRIAISTESLEQGDDFYRIRTTDEFNRPGVMELDYWLHPDHDEWWLADIKSRMMPDEDKFSREVLRNPHAGFGGFVYPDAMQKVAGDYPYQPGMQLYVAIDPGYDDETAIIWIAYDPTTARYRVVNAYENNHLPPEYYADVIYGRAPAAIESHDPMFEYRSHGIYHTHEVMDWAWWANGQGSMQAQPTVFGDPAGRQRHVGNSFYDRMQRRWSQAEWPNSVLTKWKPEDREFQGRRMALMPLLQVLDFNDHPHVHRVLHALREYRYQSGEKSRMSEQKNPMHSKESHIVTALEYWAVNMNELRGLSSLNLSAYQPGKNRSPFRSTFGRIA